MISAAGYAGSSAESHPTSAQSRFACAFVSTGNVHFSQNFGIGGVYQNTASNVEPASLLKRPAEVDEHPERKQIDADERLDARDSSDPALCSQRVLAGLYPGYPVPDVQVSPADVESGE